MLQIQVPITADSSAALQWGGILSNPCNLWKSDRLADSEATFRPAFSDRLRYARNEGFRTPENVRDFQGFGGNRNGKF